MSGSDPLLAISDLRVTIPVPGGAVRAVRGVDLAVAPGETLALVGESGCGKSVSLYSASGLLPRQIGARVEGSVLFDGCELLGRSTAELNRVRGSDIGMIFQDAVAALNPTMTVGAQIAEPLRHHRGMSRRKALARAEELLEQCRIPSSARRLKQYPFELSGGMAQRVMIAMALACGPRLLIADEPTTALDVTTQAQILNLLAELCRDRDMAMILVTHDLGVVARMADRVAVMYAGEIVETAAVEALFASPAHPYTQALLRATPDARVAHGGRLQSISGFPPDLFAPPAGCGFHQRCEHTMRLCPHRHPPLFDVSDAGLARCWMFHPDYPGGAS